MSQNGAPGADDAGPTQCPADGPLPPGRSVEDAVECNTARFVDLTRDAGGVAPVYLVVCDVDERGTSLTRTEVVALPELQNGLAYLGRGTDSVRVRTHPERRVQLEEHVEALSSRDEHDAFEFADRQFTVDVVRG